MPEMRVEVTEEILRRALARWIAQQLVAMDMIDWEDGK
jgi:hypothetical protein